MGHSSTITPTAVKMDKEEGEKDEKDEKDDKDKDEKNGDDGAKDDHMEEEEGGRRKLR